MSKRKSENDDGTLSPSRKRRHISHHQSNTTQTQTQKQRPKQRVPKNAFTQLLKLCRVKFPSDPARPIQATSNTECIVLYLQSHLTRDVQRQREFMDAFENFVDDSDGQRLDQCLQATIPKTRQSLDALRDTYRHLSLSQLPVAAADGNEDESALMVVREQPSMIGILLQVRCIQSAMVQLMLEKFDDFIHEEERTRTVCLLLQQLEYLDEVLERDDEQQQLVDKLLELLAIPDSSAQFIDKQRCIVEALRGIIRDDQHSAVAVKLLSLLQQNIELTRPILTCVAQLNMSSELLASTQQQMVEALATVRVRDIEVLVKYLLRCASDAEMDQLLQEMRLSTQFVSEHTHSVFSAFRECLERYENKVVIANSMLTVLASVKQRDELRPMDLFWCLAMFHAQPALRTKIEQLLVKKIEAHCVDAAYIMASAAGPGRGGGGHAGNDDDNEEEKQNTTQQCIVDVFDGVVELAQRLLQHRSLAVSACGLACYQLLFCSADDGTRRRHQQRLVSALTTQVGSGSKTEVDNAMRCLLCLCVEHRDSMQLHMTPLMHLVEFVESWQVAQTRLLYRMLSVLCVSVDSDAQVQVRNQLSVLLAKQMGGGGGCHDHTSAGIAGSVQLLACVAGEQASEARDGVEYALDLVDKMVLHAHRNTESFAVMCDELTLMLRRSLHDDDDGGGPIHREVLTRLQQIVTNVVDEGFTVRVRQTAQCLSSQECNYKRHGLSMKLWFDPRRNGDALVGARQHGDGADSEATEYTDRDQLSPAQHAAAASAFWLSITSVFFQHSDQSDENLMWILPPLLRLFGALCHAIHGGNLKAIDAFLTAPLLMFDDAELSANVCMYKPQQTRQIMGDSIFAAINYVRELLNVYCAEYVAHCRSNNNNDDDDLNEESDSVSQQSNVRRIHKLESRLCRRLDDLLCLEHKMEQFLSVAVNKTFQPSFVPANSREQTLMQSPLWKRKQLSFVKRTNPSQNKNSKNSHNNEEEDEDALLSTSSDDDDDEEKKKRSKKKKKKKKSPAKKKKTSSAKKPSAKKKTTSPKKKSTKSKAKSKQSPLSTVDLYFRPLDLNVAVLLQFEILDRNHFKQAHQRLRSVCVKECNRMITLRAFYRLLKDFSDKCVAICNPAHSMTTTAAAKSIAAEYTPVRLVSEYGFIFAYVSKQMRALLDFSQRIHQRCNDGEGSEDELAYSQDLLPVIEQCWQAYVECLLRVFKCKNLELACNKKVFLDLVSALSVTANHGDNTIVFADDAVTNRLIVLIQLLRDILPYLERVPTAIQILSIIEAIVKNSRFRKECKPDYFAQLVTICSDLLLDKTGEALQRENATAAMIGPIVSTLLKHHSKPLSVVTDFLKFAEDIDEGSENSWRVWLTRKSCKHFIKPIAESLTNLYGAKRIQQDVRLEDHSAIVQKYLEVAKFVEHLDDPVATGHFVHNACNLFNKCVGKIPKMDVVFGASVVANHFHIVSVLSRCLQGLMQKVRLKTTDKDAKKKKPWIRVQQKAMELRKSLDHFVMQIKTSAHCKGYADKTAIRSLITKSDKSKKAGGRVGVKREFEHDNDSNDDDDDEEEEDDEEGDDEEGDDEEGDDEDDSVSEED